MRFLIGLLLAASAFAGEITGNWTMTMQSPQGEAQFQFVVKNDGGKLEVTFDHPRLKVEKASFAGSTLQMTVKRERAEGAMVYEMKATLDGDSLKGSADTDMGGQPVTLEWSAKRGS
jgi:hypothetical protein